jgi:hypothetical protein
VNKIRRSNRTVTKVAYLAAKTSQASSCAAFKAFTTSNARGGGVGVIFFGTTPLLVTEEGRDEVCANAAESRESSFLA